MIWGIFGFLITIFILVGIHEWGHFITARFFGVRILRFSLGFGKPFLTWKGKKEGTLYTLAPIPLGGFVQMYGEGDEDVEDKSKSFSAKPAWQRFLIVFAGPAINLLFALLAFSLLFMTGVKGIAPVVAYVQEDSLAYQAGLKADDVVYSIAGRRVLLAQDGQLALSAAGHKKVPVVYLRDGVQKETVLDLSSLKAGDELRLSSVLGFYWVDEWWPATVAKVLSEEDLKDYGLSLETRLSAREMGLLPGDTILAINDEFLSEHLGALMFAQHLAKVDIGETVYLRVRRGDEVLNLSGKLGETRDGNGNLRPFLGVVWQKMPTASFFREYEVVERYPPLQALYKGTDKMAHYVGMTFSMFARLLKREVSVENMGGPLLIGDVAGRSLQIGWDVFLNFLGVVSLSLAVMNLLPIPMLDGGHMVLYAIEMVRGKPMPKRANEYLFKLGAVLLFSFMALVLYVDFSRYF